MELQERLNQQRVKYITSSYQLAGNDDASVAAYLESLFDRYPAPLIELALVESLVDAWINVPIVRGIAFFEQAHKKLQSWETQPIISTISPDQFRYITNLDPTPIFGSTELSSSCPIVRPS